MREIITIIRNAQESIFERTGRKVKITAEVDDAAFNLCCAEMRIPTHPRITRIDAGDFAVERMYK